MVGDRRVAQLHDDLSFTWTARTGEEGGRKKMLEREAVTASRRSRVKAAWALRRERTGRQRGAEELEG